MGYTFRHYLVDYNYLVCYQTNDHWLRSEVPTLNVGHQPKNYVSYTHMEATVESCPSLFARCICSSLALQVT